MKKKGSSRLTLRRETVRLLEDQGLQAALGGTWGNPTVTCTCTTCPEEPIGTTSNQN